MSLDTLLCFNAITSELYLSNLFKFWQELLSFTCSSIFYLQSEIFSCVYSFCLGCKLHLVYDILSNSLCFESFMHEPYLFVLSQVSSYLVFKHDWFINFDVTLLALTFCPHDFVLSHCALDSSLHDQLDSITLFSSYIVDLEFLREFCSYLHDDSYIFMYSLH